MTDLEELLEQEKGWITSKRAAVILGWSKGKARQRIESRTSAGTVKPVAFLKVAGGMMFYEKDELLTALQTGAQYVRVMQKGE